VSTLESKGVPAMVQRTLIRPPASRLGPISDDEREKLLKQSPVFGQYDESVDRESAFEILQKKAADKAKAEAEAQNAEETGETEERSRWSLPEFGDSGGSTKTRSRTTTRRRTSNRQSVAEAALKSVVRSVGTSLGRALVRGILGSLKRGR